MNKTKEDLDGQEIDYDGCKELIYLLDVMLSDSVSIELCNPLDKNPEKLLDKMKNLPETFEKTNLGLMLTASCKIEIQKLLM